MTPSIVQVYPLLSKMPFRYILSLVLCCNACSCVVVEEELEDDVADQIREADGEHLPYYDHKTKQVALETALACLDIVSNVFQLARKT